MQWFRSQQVGSSRDPWEYIRTTDREDFRHRPEHLSILVGKREAQENTKETIRRNGGRINRRWKIGFELRLTLKKYGVILLCIDKLLFMFSIQSFLFFKGQVFLIELVQVNFNQVVETYLVHSASENNHLCFGFGFSDLSWWVVSGFWYFSPVLTLYQVFLFFSWCFGRKVHNRICQNLKSCCQIETITFWWIRSVQLFQKRILFMFGDAAVFLLRSFIQWIIVVSLFELSSILSWWLLRILFFLFLSFKENTPIDPFLCWIPSRFFQ